MSKIPSKTQVPDFTIISLGCPKNLVDSENMVGRLCESGYRFYHQKESCDFVILNTCGFLKSARAEARVFLRALIEQKKRGAFRFLFVAGCMVNVEKEALTEEFPEIDAWIGVCDERKITEIVSKFFPLDHAGTESKNTPLFSTSPESKFHFTEPQVFDPDCSRRRLLTPEHVVYLKIAEGCSRYCTFCAIPKIRGKFTSRSKEAILEEARKLIDRGAREIVLIAQETTFWGSDLYGKPDLFGLLSALRDIPGEFRIRLLYTYPLHFEDDLISLFAEESRRGEDCRILPYIDIPLQHCNDGILKKMNRQVTRSEMENLLEKLRTRIPNLVLRTSLIAGFPGESEKMFEELLDFTRKWKFERGGSFAFSAERGTAAAKLDNPVPEKEIQRRFQELHRVQSEIMERWENTRVHKIYEVLIDQPVYSEDRRKIKDLHYGRTFAEAPEVDPTILVNGKTPGPGAIVKCEIVHIHEGNPVAVVLGIR